MANINKGLEILQMYGRKMEQDSGYQCIKLEPIYLCVKEKRKKGKERKERERKSSTLTPSVRRLHGNRMAKNTGIRRM